MEIYPWKVESKWLTIRSELEEKYGMSKEWIKGPEFLRQPERQLPKDPPSAMVKEYINTKFIATVLANKIDIIGKNEVKT